VLGISVDPLLEPSRPNGDRSKLDTMPNLFKLPTLEIQILSSEWHGSTSNGYETQRDETSHDSRRSTLVMRPGWITAEDLAQARLTRYNSTSTASTFSVSAVRPVR